MRTLQSHTLYEEMPVVRLANSLLYTAVDQAASDIHIEPTANTGRIRFRIDGVLHDQQMIEPSFMNQLHARFKVLARIDIAEKRIPQDGKFRIAYEQKEIDLRVSTFPSLYGENMVVRILDRAAQTIQLDTLGFEYDTKQAVQELLGRSQGFLLVCGPTGAGKTTTLYAALSALNSPEKHIITLEDPVEYNLAGVTQGQVNPDAGFTFATGMRSLLRQDPDIVMIGEIRDKETAQIALEASLTGHLVLSTIHTNDAPSVIMRLMDMGIEPFLINASLTGVLAQRLARKICLQCRVMVEPTMEERKILQRIGLSLDLLYRGSGCPGCKGRGYKGRIGIFELLVMTGELRSLIVHSPSLDAITHQARLDGLQPLLIDGGRKVARGIITLAELVRVAF